MKIPTSHKPKLPKELSFAIGTQLINDALAEVELAEEISIFYNHEIGGRMGLFRPGYSVVKMKGDSIDLLSFRRIISVNYSHPLQIWGITVYPVVNELVPTVKCLLKDIGLMSLRDWLLEPKAQTWYAGSRYLILGLNDDHTEFCIWETHNDRTIKKEIKKVPQHCQLAKGSSRKN